MKGNRIWKRYNANYGLPALILAETKKKMTTASLEKHEKKNLSLVIYPILLEVLQNRPTHLYQFLQNENHRLSECYSSN